VGSVSVPDVSPVLSEVTGAVLPGALVVVGSELLGIGAVVVVPVGLMGPVVPPVGPVVPPVGPVVPPVGPVGLGLTEEVVALVEGETAGPVTVGVVVTEPVGVVGPGAVSPPSLQARAARPPRRESETRRR
jgi:hypothetical protein